MTPTKSTTPKRRGRPRNAESFSDWMMRIDAEVEEAAREVCRETPGARQLTGPQRRLCEMLAEFLRSRPQLKPGEDPWRVPAYDDVRTIMTVLFRAKYPSWQPRKDGSRWVDDIPGGGGDYHYLLRNAGGHCPPPKPKLATLNDGEDD